MFKSKRKVFRFLLIVVASLVFWFSVCKISNTLLEYSENKNLYEDYSNNYTSQLPEEASSPKVETPPISVDFEKLKNQNTDIIGWLYCENTPVNYPVLQSKDNDYYLRRMINRKYNVAGSIFMDYRSKSDLSSLNTIIYGHNMKNDTMFGTFTEYKNQEYYDEHPVLWYLTPTCDYKIELISGYVTSSTSEVYTDFNVAEELSEHIKNSKAKSTFNSSCEITDISQIITLSTCSYEYSTARYVLIGKLILLK